MKKGILLVCVAILSLGTASEATAATPDAGFCNDEQTCLWKIDSAGTLTIYAKENETGVNMKNYVCEGHPNCTLRSGNRPWENSIKDISNIIIEENILNIGANAFQNATNLKTVTGLKDVKNVGEDAFWYTTNLNYIALSDDAKLDRNAFSYSGLPNCGQGKGFCGECDGYIKSDAGCVADCGTNYYPNDKTQHCIYCPQDKVVYKGQCLDEYPFAKKHYTPAEAAQWLNDDNNTVTLTFKKQ